MTEKKTKRQEELEQPVKGYQLSALADKVENLGKNFDTSLKGVNDKLDGISSSIKGVVTEDHLNARLKEIEEETEKAYKQNIKSEIEKVHLEYRPMKKGIWGLSGIVVAGVTGQIIIQIMSPFGG